MKKVSVIIVLPLFIFLGCNSSNPSADYPPIPLTLDTLSDNYRNKSVNKVRKIFRKGVAYRYHAVYTDVDNTVISNNYVDLIPTGERWDMQPDLQDVVQLKFGSTNEEMARVFANPVNKTYDHANRWTDETWEGIIENDETVWIHPIRHNQYIFTEVAPFPEVIFPLETGKTWAGGIGGLGGWGDWDGMDIMSTYEISSKEKVSLPFGKLECWVIEAKSEFDLGTSTAVFHFHEDLGFVKMDYINYVNQRLVFEMEKVETY
ncbi:MAG: hypothetical protein AAF502_03525 [Bacteroidota bacterium]